MRKDSQKSYIKNSVDLVEKLKQIDISENSILSSFDIVSMHTSIDVSKSEQLLQNKLENNYHLIEEMKDLFIQSLRPTEGDPQIISTIGCPR